MENTTPKRIQNENKEETTLYSTLMWILDKEDDMPVCYGLSNTILRSLPIPKPDHDIRRYIIESVAHKIDYYNEAADQRLVGAPPGYLGYDVGGELTNAIKQNPFSVVLFDEIEKANPKILDMFLQILDDGRLTSGRGETVYFSESLIIFTSNLGVYEVMPDGTRHQVVTPDMPYEQVSEKITNAIDDFFRYKINRPEILNRMGKNIIVFDFIRKETASMIFDKMLGNVAFRLKDSHNIELKLSDNAREQILSEICKNLSMGGRGVGNTIEEVLINPLSSSLFENTLKNGGTLTVDSILHGHNGWELNVSVS